ncbi:hypothetical protein UCDDS831_g08374 [Diplodia seriata]|uniref:Uncharacterized protein n=1 Tax=Diplodia seriata TaxID=420778 RepID=A0A0G2DU24_9PEZI|nr:hypothetical protein UCDDS831_g08374 [Diplodia seriata]
MLHPTSTIIGAAARRTLTTMPYRLRSTCPRGTRIAAIRATTKTTAPTAPMTMTNSTRLFHHSRTVLGSTKEDHMERDRLNPSSTEYSKSGSDDDAAKMSDAAFNPDKTSPEEAVGPGNQEVSSSKDPEQGGPDRSPSESGEPSSRARSSSRGSPKKHGDGKTGGGGVY